MFDIGWSEILVIVVVAIVVVGPKDLPPMLRAFGRTVTKFRKMAGEFQGQFNEALREAELDDVKKSFDELRGLNPLGDIRRSLDPMAGPIAKPAPAPTPPSANQMAQLDTPKDLEPAPPLPEPATMAVAAAEPVAKPKRVRTPKSAGIAVAEGEVVVRKARAPKIAIGQASAVNGEAAVASSEIVAVARKPRTAKPKTPPVTAAPAPTDLSAPDEPTFSASDEHTT